LQYNFRGIQCLGSLCVEKHQISIQWLKEVQVIRQLLGFLIVLLVTGVIGMPVIAQHTFSIVAVDPETGEVGSAGASCLRRDVALISTVLPGIGALHTQALYLEANQKYGSELLGRGLGPQEIIDSLVAYDIEGTPGVRQYGVAVLAAGGSAAFTGEGCFDYKGHRIGPAYSIQGNILLGPVVLDSMEARFLRTSGSLADRLMAAMQGANVPGADSRCLSDGVSSYAGFLRVARLGDTDTLYLDLRAVPGAFSLFEPIDSLQRMYDLWKSTSSVAAEQGRDMPVLEILYGQSAGPVINISFHEAGDAELALYDLGGRRVEVLLDGWQLSGRQSISLNETRLPAGVYYCRLAMKGMVVTRRVVVSGRR
jgi:uncharacterized Ntn-hydrolase superfamily protein